MLTKIKSRDILISILITLTLTLLGIYISSIVVNEDKNKSDFYYYSNSNIFINPVNAIDINHVTYDLNKTLSNRSINFDNENYIIKLEGISEKEIDAQLIELNKIIKQLNNALVDKLLNEYEFIQNAYAKFLDNVDDIIMSQEEIVSTFKDSELGSVELLEMSDKYYETNRLILEKELKYAEFSFLVDSLKNDPNYQIITLGPQKITSTPVNYFNSSKLIIIFLFFIIGIFISWLILEFKSFFRVRK